MAKVRIGFSTQFELENELVGIGTDNPTNTLQALGNIRSSDAKAIGVSTLTTFDGFTDTKARIEGSAGAKQGTTSGEIIVEGEITVSTGTTFTSGPENLTVTDSFTLPGISDDKPSVGTTRFNENLGSLEFYTGVEWRAVNSYVDMTGGGSRGYIAGGYDGSAQIKNIDLIHISTLGNAVDFGEPVADGKKNNAARASSRTRGFTLSGSTSPGNNNTITYFSLSTSGVAEDFGDATFSNGGAALASSTRAVQAEGSTSTKAMDYIEMATRGNAIDFGDRYVATSEMGAVSSPTRGLWCGGGAPSGSAPQKQIDSITIASKGSSHHFGDLTTRRGQLGGGVSSGTRGVIAGGGHSPVFLTSIDYMTIASDGNAVYFGELATGRVEQAGATCNCIRGIFAAGYVSASPNRSNSMEYITIASTGNAMDFGDLTSPRDRVGGGCISDSHGGLGGF